MHQLTHRLPKNQGFEFKLFSEKDILYKNAKQYISSHIRIIDSTYVEKFDDDGISNEDLMKFMIENKLNIINHFKTSIKIN